MKVEVNLFRQVKALEALKNETYTNTAIAEKAGLSRLTVNSLMSGDTNRIDLSTIAKLLDFFKSEGMEIKIQDLFTVTDRPD